MAEYIEREAVFAGVEKRIKNPVIVRWLESIVADVPAADVAPVVHEKWEWREEWETHPETHSCDLVSCGWYCTGCGIELGDYLSKNTGQHIILDDDFVKPKLACCPNCGARMDLKGD